MMTTLGISQNNPGNLDRTPNMVWEGELESDNRFCRFTTAKMGIRAMLITLRSYLTRDKCATIGDVINRWAPRIENETQAYVDDVVSWFQEHLPGGTWDEHTAISDENIGEMITLAQAICHHENGAIPWPTETWNQAWAMVTVNG